ncbi:hypothetical protein NDU88_003584 [Pleurodeles waltl]|uniref:Uncharacterized protein n=1 Tax=Pleurodeles waltl TaxID=8319 RepID=A0AAV7TP04_PLEWA|nr:hypothetical protein NDU88_003584 [Pleurodeles waltl]
MGSDYIAFWIRREIPKELRSRLRSEFPSPSLPDKFATTPELDVKVVAFITKNSKDPRKGLDKGLKSCQVRLVDLNGHITKMLELAEKAYLNEASVDPKKLRQWAHCLLGNANTALSNGRRKSIFLRIDPKFKDLASKEGGPSTQGHLFGDDFIKDMTKYVGVFSSI